MLLPRRPPPITESTKRRKALRFHGWRIARAGLMIQVLHSGLVFNAFSLFSAQLQGEFGWSNSVFGGAFALNRAESGLLGPLQGWMIDKFGPRWVLRLGAVIMGVGFLAFSAVTTVTGFYLSYLMIAMGSSLGGFLTITVAIVHWFEKKRARALAFTSMGFAVGGTLAFGVGVVINTIGWRRTAQLGGIVSLVVILWLSRHFDRKPSDVGLLPDGDTVEDAAPDDLAPEAGVAPRPALHFTAGEAMRTRAFWFLSLGHSSALLVVGATMAHLAVFLDLETTLGALHGSVVVGTLPAMMGVGQILGGYLGDIYDKRLLITVAMVGHGAGILILALAHSPLLVWLFVLVHGLAWGVRGPLQQAIRADYFGATDFGKIMGFSSLVVMLGMMIGPITAGAIADATGSFRPAFVILGVAAGLGGFWFWFADPPRPPVRATPAVDHGRTGPNGSRDAERQPATDVDA